MNIATPGHSEYESILYLNGVTKSFDGFKAINNLSLIIEPGELRAIIGPNGAGKSTMMDIITGKTKPDAGEVKFKDIVDLTRFDETDIANMGIGRKFQKPTVIESLSVFDNMDLALAGNRGIWQTLLWKGSNTRKARVDEKGESCDQQHTESESGKALLARVPHGSHARAHSNSSGDQ